MPAYRLILSDELYVKLVKIAGEKGTTLGKLINLVLKGYVDNYLKNRGVEHAVVQ